MRDPDSPSAILQRHLGLATRLIATVQDLYSRSIEPEGVRLIQSSLRQERTEGALQVMVRSDSPSIAA